MVSCITEDVKTAQEVIDLLNDIIIPVGKCTCPNNGAGDCLWCQTMETFRYAVADKIEEAIINTICDLCKDGSLRLDRDVAPPDLVKAIDQEDWHKLCFPDKYPVEPTPVEIAQREEVLKDDPGDAR